MARVAVGGLGDELEAYRWEAAVGEGELAGEVGKGRAVDEPEEKAETEFTGRVWAGGTVVVGCAAAFAVGADEAVGLAASFSGGADWL